ncbi:uncharacterized protein TNIN_9431 [Trichonephila inaurata madagascariensis]|uniref:Uncharacterized protein n=1 Tax=Trichonephila inaurata madagascariensis TaxID=2747483 RepID=A0A8X6WRW3_9ARAC|nr:uncharacterized protein TNIN_298411 [Trichonephila inaurata madagascariensis]GFY50189.1 uncharacterized protein TNIN_9431 [Trichonephila inaurata madagascariensis]
MLTLKEICLVEVAAEFVNNSDARGVINDNREEVWKKAIREDAPVLGIPLTLLNEIIEILKPMKIEIDCWTRDHNGIFTTEQECSVEFFFNGDGTVNRIKTADSLIYSEWLSVTTRFVLACEYLSRKDILTFFKNLSEAERNKILHEYSQGNKELNRHEEKVAQWINHYKAGCISESEPWGCSSYRYNWTDVSLQSRLLDNLSKEDRNTLLVAVFKNTTQMHVGRFCLSRLSSDHREQLLTRFPAKVLSLYLFRPYHNFFLDAADKVWDLLPENDFISLLHIIIYRKIGTFCKDFDYVELLRQFWQRSPDHLKQGVEGIYLSKTLMEVVKLGWQIERHVVSRLFFRYIQCGKENSDVNEDIIYDLIWTK